MSETKKVKVIIDGQTVEKEVVMKQDGFNGETGEPVMVEMVANGFDGETGQALYSKISQNGFDGETGEAVYVINAEVADEVGAPKNGFSTKILKTIGIVAVVVLAVAGAALAAFKSGMFLNKQDRILLAAYETIKEDTIAGTLLDAADILNNDTITTEINGEISSSGYTANCSGELKADRKNAQLYAGGNVEVAGIVDQKGEFYFDDSRIQFALPNVKKTVYEYNYKKDNDGFLVRSLEKELNCDIDDLNETLSAAVEITKLSDEYTKEVTSNVRKAAKKIKVSDAPKETFEIDGKERKCKGYRVTITGDNVIDILEAYRKAQNKVYGDAYDRLNDSLKSWSKSSAKLDIDTEIDKLENEAEFMDDIEFDVYLYKGKLAAITGDADNVKVSVEFQGGDTRTSNVAFIAKSSGEKVVVKKKSSISDRKEKGSIAYDGASVLNYSYDKDTGKIRVEADELSFTGNFLVKGNTISCSYDGSVEGVTADINVKISKGSRISALSGDVFDLGNADEDQLMDEANEIRNELMPVDDFDI